MFEFLLSREARELIAASLSLPNLSHGFGVRLKGRWVSGWKGNHKLSSPYKNGVSKFCVCSSVRVQISQVAG